MSSRDAILAAIRRNKPAPVDLPAPASFPAGTPDLVAAFTAVLTQGGGRVLEVAGRKPAAVLADAYPEARRIGSMVPDRLPGTVRLEAVADPHDLADLDLFVCEGVLGVAENGAVWLPESHLGHRAAPFLTQHLAILLDRTQLVWNLHEAYARLEVAAEGFGVFVAGPSKTADIEQSLVIGAHGPRSLTVLLADRAARGNGQTS